MKLIKDILIFYVETTGQSTESDAILQLSGVLLDKDNLLEKNFFNSYVKVSFLDGTLKTHADQLGIGFEQIRKSPKLTEVIKGFVETFGYDPLLACHSVSHYLFLQKAFKKTVTPFTYDSHLLDIWSLGYIYALHYGIKKIPTLQTLAHQFNIKIANPTNALEKARASAQVFTKIING